MLKDARKILKMYRDCGCMSLEQLEAVFRNSSIREDEMALYLYDLKYLKIEPNHALLENLESGALISPDTPLVISIEGKAALEHEEDGLKYRRFNEIRAWITAAIAVMSFIKSFFF